MTYKAVYKMECGRMCNIGCGDSINATIRNALQNIAYDGLDDVKEVVIMLEDVRVASVEVA